MPPPPPLPQPTTINAASPLGTALAKLLSDPFGPETLVRLTQLQRHLEDAFKQDRVAEALDVCNSLVAVEQKAPESARNAYAVILKRLLNRSSLAQIAPYLLESRRKDRAIAVLRRGGEDALGLLLGLLGSAQTLGERMAYLDVIKGIYGGSGRVVALLSRSEWQVVRNTAEAVGEARLEEAVPYLARLTEHSDDRVCRAALVALARIGTGATIEPIRATLQKAAPELRALVANAIGGPQARPLVTLLASLADGEDNADVIRAYYKAIGRIGTAEAKNALEKAAAVRTLFSRRAKVAAEAAAEVLKTLGA
jgi:HEAT repeat protein